MVAYIDMKPLPALTRPPEARAETVEQLVHFAQSGKIRVPEFQRGLRWESEHVLDLFDSIYRGLPIGSLMVVKRDVSAGRVQLGPLAIHAPSVPEAWLVIDGQQRVTSIAASLSRPQPLPTTASDPFVVYFDAAKKIFKAPTRDDAVGTTWVPLPLLLDAARLGEWIMEEWEHRGDRELTRAVFEAGKRIREYRVPLYVIETDDNETLRDIFFRVNTAGKPLEWGEVHDALYGHEGAAPSTVTGLASELAAMKMGRLDNAVLTSCLVALRGLDVTRTLAEHRRRNRDVLRGAVVEALPVLRQVLSFLKTHASIPHLRLLPRSYILEILTRFFFHHRAPNPRTTALLTRWIWRVLLDERAADERALRRHGITAIDKNEEASVQRLLALLPRDAHPISMPDRFDARAADSRLVLLALASLGPREIHDGHSIDVAMLIEENDVEAFRAILPVRSGVPALARSPANRVLLSGRGSARSALAARIASHGVDDPVLASHAISAAAARALTSQRVDEFFVTRARLIIETLRQLGERLAGWSRGDRDRPSIAHLLRQSEHVA